MTKNEDISNPFEVTERKTLVVQNVVDKNKYLTILFFSQQHLSKISPINIGSDHDGKGSFTIVNIYVLVQRVLGGGGSEASVLFFKMLINLWNIGPIIKSNATGR